LTVIGAPGLGKTMLAICVATKQVQLGYSARFITAQAFASGLGRVATSVGRQRLLKPLLTRDVLVLDELGYLPTACCCKAVARPPVAVDARSGWLGRSCGVSSRAVIRVRTKRARGRNVCTEMRGSVAGDRSCGVKPSRSVTARGTTRCCPSGRRTMMRGTPREEEGMRTRGKERPASGWAGSMIRT
jgi:hypothetical protein